MTAIIATNKNVRDSNDVISGGKKGNIALKRPITP